MALALTFEIRLEERCSDRVVVSVLLAPTEGSATLDGVALQLVNRRGDALGSRVLLPIAGTLHQAMLSTVELRAPDDVPLGARVVGTAWLGTEQREAAIPTEPFTEFEVHVRARKRLGPLAGPLELEALLPEERAIVARYYPWIDEPRISEAVGELTVVESEDEDPIEGVDNLGLDDDNAEWLEELLTEDGSA
jgi:hypothetical protein